MHEGDLNRCLPLNGEQLENRLRCGDEVTYDAGRYIAVQAAVGAGENEELFAEIDDVSRERKEGEKKDGKKQALSFLKPIGSDHN